RRRRGRGAGRSDGARAPRRPRPGAVPARAADTRGARRISSGRDREMVAHHRESRDQDRMMNIRFLILGVAALWIAGTARAADVHVMISAGFFHAYSELVPKFEQHTGHHVITVRGP